MNNANEWISVALGRYCKIKTGKKDVNEGNPFGQFPFFTCSRDVTWSDEYSFDTEAILIAGNGEVGNLHYYNGKFEAYQRTYVLDGFSINIDYVYQYLKGNLLNSLEKEKVGTSIPYIKLSNLTEFKVHIPKGIEAQKKIAYILKTIDQAIEKTEALIHKYQQIKAGLMHDLFTRGVTADGKLRPSREQAPKLYKETPIGWIPKEWEVTQFRDCIDVLTDYHANGAYEILKKHVELLDHPDFALMIRTTNFERDDFDIDIKYISKTAYYFLDKSIVQPKDILMNKIANPGTVYLMPDLGIPVSLGMNLFLIRVKKKYSPVFIYSFLRKHEDYVKSFSSGTGTKTITKDSVRALIIGLPTPAEQEKIGVAIFSIEQKIRKEKKLLAKLNKQKSGIMYDLLTGKVPVKIDQKETAHV